MTCHPTRPARALTEWALTEGEHGLCLENYENLGQASMRLAWEHSELPAVLVTAALTAVPLPQEITVLPSE